METEVKFKGTKTDRDKVGVRFLVEAANVEIESANAALLAEDPEAEVTPLWPHETNVELFDSGELIMSAKIVGVIENYADQAGEKELKLKNINKRFKQADENVQQAVYDLLKDIEITE